MFNFPTVGEMDLVLKLWSKRIENIIVFDGYMISVPTIEESRLVVILPVPRA